MSHANEHLADVHETCVVHTLVIVFSAMTAPTDTPRHLYLAWLEDQIEDYKASLTRDELLSLADEAVNTLFHSPDGQYPLTEILLCDAVDALLFQRLSLPDYKQWSKQCRTDTAKRPRKSTQGRVKKAS